MLDRDLAGRWLFGIFRFRDTCGVHLVETSDRYGYVDALSDFMRVRVFAVGVWHLQLNIPFGVWLPMYPLLILI